MARVGRPSTFILHSLGTRAGTEPRVDVFVDVRAADSAPPSPPRAGTAPNGAILAIFRDRERRVGGPARLGRPSLRYEEAQEHQDPPGQEDPVAEHVQPGKGHVPGPDLERQDIVPETADDQRHDAEEDHDRAVHRAELIVELGNHHAPRHIGLTEQSADYRKDFTRVGQLPAHDYHQRKTKQKEQKRGYTILQTNDLMVYRKDILS